MSFKKKAGIKHYFFIFEQVNIFADLMLSDKHAPFTLAAMVGNRDPISKLVEFGIQAQKKMAIKPILICGPSGIGKTSAAHAFAYSNGFDLLELNASDYRDEEKLNKILVASNMSQGLFGKRLLILLDEIDELSKKFDTGAEKIITQIVKTSKQPVILIANDFWNQKISFLRNYVEKVEFKRPKKEEVVSFLEGILAKENRSMDKIMIELIATRSNGDIRASINDLELMLDAKPELIENLGVRSAKLEIFAVLDKIFLSRNFDTARNALTNTDIEMDMMLNWLEENIQNRYSGKREISDAFNSLAQASWFFDKARRTNYYGYLRYSSILMSSGVAIANRTGANFAKHYMFPANIKHLSKTKKERNLKASAASKLIYKLHAHKRDVINSHMPLFKLMIEQHRLQMGEEKMYETFESSYGLEKEETENIAQTYFN